MTRQRFFKIVRDIPYNWPRSFVDEVRWFVQRGRRGWSVRDTWGFDSYLAEVIAGGVEHLKAHRHTMFTLPHPDDETVGPWEAQYQVNHAGDSERTDIIMQEIVDGFRAATAIIDLERLDGQPFDPAYRFEREYALLATAQDHFKEHFFALWE